MTDSTYVICLSQPVTFGGEHCLPGISTCSMLMVFSSSWLGKIYESSGYSLLNKFYLLRFRNHTQAFASVWYQETFTFTVSNAADPTIYMTHCLGTNKVILILMSRYEQCSHSAILSKNHMICTWRAWVLLRNCVILFLCHTLGIIYIRTERTVTQCLSWLKKWTTPVGLWWLTVDTIRW